MSVAALLFWLGPGWVLAADLAVSWFFLCAKLFHALAQLSRRD